MLLRNCKIIEKNNLLIFFSTVAAAFGTWLRVLQEKSIGTVLGTILQANPRELVFYFQVIFLCLCRASFWPLVDSWGLLCSPRTIVWAVATLFPRLSFCHSSLIFFFSLHCLWNLIFSFLPPEESSLFWGEHGIYKPRSESYGYVTTSSLLNVNILPFPFFYF